MSTLDKKDDGDKGPIVEMLEHPDNPKTIEDGKCPRCGMSLKEEDLGECGCAGST